MEKDWGDSRFDRLSERVDRIEQERRAERQQALDGRVYAMLALVWLMTIATIVVTIAKHAS